MSATIERPSLDRTAILAVALTLPGSLVLLTFALHDLLGLGGLYDRVLVPLDHSVPGEALIGVMILLCPAGAMWFGFRGLRHPTLLWRGTSLVALLGGLSLLLVFVSHMVFDR